MNGQVTEPTNVYFRNIPNHWSNDDLLSLINEKGLGTVKQSRVMVGQNRVGMAFADFATSREANMAINALNGYLDQRRGLTSALEVRLASRTVDKVPVQSAMASPDPDTNVFIQGFPFYWTEENLTSWLHSNDCGPVTSCRVIRDATNASTRRGLARMTTREAASACIQKLNGQFFGEGFDTALTARLATKPKDKRAREPWAANLAPGTEGDMLDYTNLYCVNLPKTWVDSSQLVDYILQNTPNLDPQHVMSSRLMKREDPSAVVAGFVRMEFKAECDAIINALNGSTPPGATEPITIRFANDPLKTAKPMTGTGPYGEPIRPFKRRNEAELADDNLFFTNVPSSWDEPTFKNFILSKGFSDVTTVRMLDSDGSKRRAFARFSTPEGAKRALQAFSGLTDTMNGVTEGLIVRFAHAGNTRQTDTMMANIVPPVPPGTDPNIYIANFPETWGEPELKGYLTLQGLGPITSARVVRDKDGSSKKSGFARFTNLQDATLAIQRLNGLTDQNRKINTPIVARFANNPKSQGGPPGMVPGSTGYYPTSPQGYPGMVSYPAPAIGGGYTAPSAAASMTKLIFKNLPTNWGSESLTKFIQHFNHNARDVKVDQSTGMPVGSAVFGTVQEAQAAMFDLNGFCDANWGLPQPLMVCTETKLGVDSNMSTMTNSGGAKRSWHPSGGQMGGAGDSMYGVTGGYDYTQQSMMGMGGANMYYSGMDSAKKPRTGPFYSGF